ncbi:MAG: cysteine desulfurase-like protein [Nesterenkonia sp.]
MSGFDLPAFRSHFPALDSGVAFFDSPGGTQAPRQVGEAIAQTLTSPLSNRGVQSVSERNAEETVAAFRSAYADLLGADPAGIVYGRSATQLTYDFSRHLSKDWGPGDEVVVTRLDHDSNVRPWVQAAERAGAAVRWIELDPATAQLDTTELDSIITDRTRLVAITAASNLLGTVPDVASIARRAHSVGALVYVDGVHYAAHHPVDVDELGADFFVCSPYKFLGPHCAVLAAAPSLLEGITPDKLLPATDAVPERFEFGTLPYEIMAGATAAVDFIGAATAEPGTRRHRLHTAQQALESHQQRLAGRILRTLDEDFAQQVSVHSRAQRRTPTLFLTLAEQHAQQVSRALSDHGIHAPAGSFYAYETVRALNLADEAGLRIGIAPYTSDDDVDRLLTSLRRTIDAKSLSS